MVDLGQDEIDLGQDEEVVGVVVVGGAVGHELLLRHHPVLVGVHVGEHLEKEEEEMENILNILLSNMNVELKAPKACATATISQNVTMIKTFKMTKLTKLFKMITTLKMIAILTSSIFCILILGPPWLPAVSPTKSRMESVT